MMVSRTLDVTKINNVLKHPAIFDRIAEDGVFFSVWQPDLKDAFYLTDDQNIGVMVYHWINGITLECHVQVLPEHREKAFEFGQEAIKWAWSNTKATKIVAQIPAPYYDVLKFAYKSGFSFEGNNKQSYRKNGVVYDQYYVGLIKPQGGCSGLG